jgi:hypothetical protein
MFSSSHETAAADRISTLRGTAAIQAVTQERVSLQYGDALSRHTSVPDQIGGTRQRGESAADEMSFSVGSLFLPGVRDRDSQLSHFVALELGIEVPFDTARRLRESWFPRIRKAIR